ncbi:MAG: alpha-2-macroglobulin family protein, partial [Candidatus Eremiobacterota bacterium]
VTFEIQDGKGNKVFKTTQKLSDFGVASSEFHIADEVNMGEYHIKASVDKEITEKTVTVKRYVLPKFNNIVKTDREYYLPGQTLKGSVQSGYFFGKPVSEMEVKIVFSTFYVKETKLFELNGKTDKEGFFSFEYKLPDYFTGLPLEGGKAKLEMEITVTDSAKHQEITYKSLSVVKEGIQITVVPESAQLLPGIENTVYILTGYPDGSPASTTLDVKLKDKTEKIKTDITGFAEFKIKPSGLQTDYEINCYDEKGNSAAAKGVFQTGQADSLLLRTDKALYRTGEPVKVNVFYPNQAGTAYVDIIRDGQTLFTRSMEIKNGKAYLEWTLTPDCAGSLALHAYRITREGQIIRDMRKIVVTPSNDLSIEVSPDKVTYLPGEDGEINFKVLNKEGKPAISVLGVDIVDESLFALADRKPGFEKLYFLLEGELLEPKYEIHGISFKDLIYDFEGNKFADKNQKLSQVILKKTSQSEPFTLNTDSYVEELKNLCRSFSLINTAIYSYYNKFGQWPADISCLIKNNYLKESDCYDPWGNMINISTGRVTTYPLIYSSGPDGKGGTGDDTGSNNIKEILQPYIPDNDPFWSQLWLGTEFIPTTCGIDTSSAAPENSYSTFLMGSEPLSESYSSSATVPTSRPGPPCIQNQKPARENAEKTRIREYFPETLYTNPEVITDEHGMAKINVKMADSITSWRLTSFASSLKGEMGNKESPLKVFQDFFVDIDLPVFLTGGDEVSVPVAVYNYLPEKQKVRIELVEDKWFNLMDVPAKEITLEKDQVSVLYFRIRAHDVGLHPLTVNAKGTKAVDAIKRTVDVAPDGKLFLMTESGRLTGSIDKTVEIPKKSIPGASKILVTLYPGLFSQVVEGLDKILRMPSGCFEQTSSTTYPNILVLDYMKKSGKITPELQMKAEDYINKGYQRLLTFEVPGGGFSWFGTAPANKILTAFGLMEFKDMSKVHDVDPVLITRTLQWLEKHQLPDGSWKPDEEYLHAESWAKLQNSNLPVTAYITWALIESGYANKSVTDKAVSYIKENYKDGDDPYILAIIANALTSYDRSDKILDKILEKLMEMKKEDKETVYWDSRSGTITFSGGISSTVETTALITIAMLQSDRYLDVANKSIAFLIKNKDPYGTWYSTQPTILALRALLLAEEKSADEVNVAGSVLINGKKNKDFNINPTNFDLYQQFDLSNSTVEGSNLVEIKFEGIGNCLYQIVTKYYLPQVEEVKDNEPLSIEVSYDRTKLRQNDIVECMAHIVNNADEDLNMAIVDLGIPPGFTVETDELQKLVESKIIQKYSLTGRQVIIYLEKISAEKPLVFNYRLRAKYPLKVQVPPSRVYEYYNPENVTETKPF